MPIDPDGCAVDVARTCRVQMCKPWRDSPIVTPVRWYRCEGAPALGIVSCFMSQWQKGILQEPDPRADQAGFYGETVAYDKGRRPFWVRPNGHFTGSPRQWFQGSDIATDPNLTWTPFQASAECLAGLGVDPVAQRSRSRALDGFSDQG
jgi:hypothetical protein